MTIIINTRDDNRDGMLRIISLIRERSNYNHPWVWIRRRDIGFIIEVEPTYRLCKPNEPIILNDDGSYYMNLEYLEPYKD